MRKGICSVLLAALSVCAAVSFAGCGGKTNEVEFDFSLESIMQKYDAAQYEYSGEPCTVTMSHWDSNGASIERAVVEQVLEGFKLRYPAIDVDLEIISNYEQTYANTIASGKLHDVFLVPDGMFAQWSVGDVMQNLNPFIAASPLLTQENLGSMFSSALQRYRYDPEAQLTGSGNQLALPKDIGPQVMYYNKAAFREMNVELPPPDRVMTIPEAAEMWKKLVKTEGDRVTRYAVTGLTPEGLVWSGGGDFLNDTRTAFPTEPGDLAALKQGYQFLQDAMLTHRIMPPGEFTVGMAPNTLFSTQKTACLISGRWEVASFRTLPFDWDVAYIPSFEAEPSANMWSGSVGYAVFNKTERKEAAWKLVEYIASKEGQEILAATGFSIPVYEDLAMDEDLVKREKELGPANYEIFVQSAKNQRAGLWQYLPGQRWKVDGYDTTSEKLFSTDPADRLTVDEYLAEVKTKVNRILGAA